MQIDKMLISAKFDTNKMKHTLTSHFFLSVLLCLDFNYGYGQHVAGVVKNGAEYSEIKGWIIALVLSLIVVGGIAVRLWLKCRDKKNNLK